MITLDFSGISVRRKQDQGKTFVFDLIRKKWLVLTPEELVRQYVLRYLIDQLSYPASLIAVEKTIRVGELVKRFDVVVFNRRHQPWMLIECKEPKVPLSEDTLHQLLRYHSVLSCKYWVLTNGHQTFCADACDVNEIRWLEALPAYDL